MLAIKVGAWGQSYEELRSVCVLASIGHGEETSSVVRDVSVCPFILEFFAVDGLATSAVTTGEIPSLTHKAWNDAVEGAAFEGQRLFRLALALSLQCKERGNSLRSSGSFWRKVRFPPFQLHHLQS
eukprot:Skav223120  [mRNA]  locus=scaffold419:817318:818305:+ [translate_table: standard]